MTAVRAETIPAALAESVRRYGPTVAVVDTDGTETTYDQLHEEVRAAAASLTRAGLGVGDRIALWAPNSAAWIRAALAVYECGATLLPINTRYKGAEVVDVLERASARLLLTVADFLGHDHLETLEASGVGRDRATALESIVLLSPSGRRAAIGWDDLLAGELDSRGPERARAGSELGPEDCCNLLFTSGTTGRSKGAMLRHGPTLRAYADWVDLVGVVPGDRFMILNPLFHSFGLHSGLLASVLAGATMYPEAVYEPARLAARLESEAITVMPAPPTVFQGLLAWAEGADTLPRWALRAAITGATTIPVSLIRAMHDDLGLEVVLTGYGLTECTGVATMARPGDPLEVVAGTSGRAVAGVEVRVVDEHGAAVGPGEPGEVLIRGYNLMAGYLDDPEQTREAIDADGWLHTGDVGVMDASGNLQITDRIKDMYIVGGFNAYPAEIERVLIDHPAIADVAVIGVEDDRLGEVGAAYVVIRPDQDLTLPALTDWCRERMANFKVPRHLVVVDALPRNATGKVDKLALRAGQTDQSV